MRKSLFEQDHYKTYLYQVLELRAETEKGQRSKLSKFIGCQPAYLSQILNGPADLSPQQAMLTNQFLGHTESEGRFFLNLVLGERAGNKDLKQHYKEEIKRQRQELSVIRNRITANRTLNEKDQARYYSSWHYAAIHAIVSVPGYRNKQSISKALKLSARITNEALEFLTEIGLLLFKSGSYAQGEASLYLGSDSPFIYKHHANWRMRTLQSLDQPSADDLHYSSVMTCSKEDLKKIKELMIQTIRSARGLIKDSKDETLASYFLDLISLTHEESAGD